MSFRTILGSVFGVLVLLTGRLLVAQISGCHIELSDINPQITQIVLVNDSNQPIEAFRISQQCKSGAPYSRNDALDGPDTMGAIDGENGSPSRTIGVEPGGKWYPGLQIRNITKIVVSECEPQIDAVIFADGSYEGKDIVVFAMKARRDGISAGLNYWVKRIKKENPDGSGIGSLLADLKNHVAEDNRRIRNIPFDQIDEKAESMPRAYWEGWRHVDENLRIQFPNEQSEDKASEILQRVTNLLDRWKKKFDSDLSMKKLNVTFPPIQEPAGTSNNIAAQP